ncbi:transglycosylase domain-containing protein [Pallidibacillus thermolactis]|jgi:1A family penicillin-binding protein|uniref:transglycosylase domain-containing protein n=1 Tax=Pallidibacillus thermolactis TaxID=251051 RepID=UPI00156BB47E|nr:PBP1A family penicillin-binding protein [Pallidibacillus thermolactis]MCU9600210.1 PBP1A family penicillin-binding protein [Pallidibacillus thermolactis subsp. kokeshiiformis]MED1673418.1 PBP1A family penicillin-binding protein [Pallidibacillus thermolactis subsp. kokeshiiformis]
MELTSSLFSRRTIKIVKFILTITSLCVIILFLSLVGLYTFAKIAGPPPIEVPQSTIFFAADGTKIGETNHGQKRYWVELEDISPHLVEATLAIEDQHFYTHFGFDYKRILGALVADIKALSKVQGASTISQQYARNLFLNHEKTWSRKLKEAFYTIRLETNFSKDDILEGYLNTIYYGHGVYGIEAASQFYFNKKAKDLNLSEAALLAGVPKGPSYFSPLVAYENAKNRQELILHEMAKQGRITKKEASIAATQPIEFAAQEAATIPKIAPYFQDVVKSKLKEIGLDEQTINLGGLQIHTTLDPKMQKIAEEQFEKTFPKNSQLQGALVAMDPKTGFVKALIGGRDYNASSFNRAIQSKRQPGSTIKPILYYAALEKGFTPSSTFRSEETTFTFNDGRKPYTPHNFNHKYAEDDITLIQALALSDNVYAVKTHLYLGMDTLAETTKRFGIKSPTAEIPSAALGTSNVRLIEMANAYSLLANGGKNIEPVFITKITDRNGNIVYEHKKERTQVLDKDVAFVTTHLMTGVFDDRLNDYTTVTGHNIRTKLTQIYAGKSGTTDYDSWMIGFTPNLVTAVWVGYDKGKKMSRTDERQYAKNIWADFMEKSLDGTPVRSFKPSSGVIGVYIDPETGLLASDKCLNRRFTYYVKGTEPTEYCDGKRPDELDLDKEPNRKEIETDDTPWYKRWFDWLN